MTLEAVSRPGARGPAKCTGIEVSDPTSVSLLMVDDDGDILINRTKGGIVCSAQNNQPSFVKIGVAFKGPLNCKNSAVPTGNSPSTGSVAINASGSPDTDEFVGTMNVKCKN